MARQRWDRIWASVRERFDAKWTLDPGSGCWLWTGAVFRASGYGAMAMKPAGPQNAHRVAWLIYVGPIIGRVHVCHRCDVKLCVNPSHLFLGTSGQNQIDAVAKGRVAYTKLTPALVADIRSSRGESQRALARRFGISQTEVRDVLKRRVWAWC